LRHLRASFFICDETFSCPAVPQIPKHEPETHVIATSPELRPADLRSAWASREQAENPSRTKATVNLQRVIGWVDRHDRATTRRAACQWESSVGQQPWLIATLVQCASTAG